MRVLAEYLQSLGSIFSNVKVRISYLCFTCYCSKAMDGTVTGQQKQLWKNWPSSQPPILHRISEKIRSQFDADVQ